jgi:arsenate reductase
VEPNVVLYLETPPTAARLEAVLGMLGMSPRDLMRRNEAPYKELSPATLDDPAKLIDSMVAHPKLIQRPIVIRGERAAVGRPPEAVLNIL